MVRRRLVRGVLVLAGACLVGCGGSGGDGSGPAISGRSGRASASKTVKFVGFDASEALVRAMQDGEIEGLVVQNPYRMGQLAVRTLVDHLEGRKVEPQVSTGETLATPENMEEPEIKKLLNPPKEATSGPSTVSASKAKKWRIMVIPKGTTHEFWQSIHAGAVKAATDLGNVELIWQGPQKESERDKQIELLQNAVASRVDGVALAPLDAEALVQPVEQVIERGIAVVIFDSALGATKSTARPISYVATNNYRGGVLAAQRLGEVLKGEGRIILLRYAVNSESTEQRERGFTDTMAKEFPKITYLSQDQYAGATADTAQKKAESLIARYRGKVDGIFCCNESSAFGMLRALEAAGMVKSRP